ncbi:MAG: hypothetical protein ACRYFW_06955 [Janthinobacterium lividum]
MAIRIVCGWCGSTEVSRDAWASWDEDAQAWVLGTVLDDGFCHRCERERGLEERAIGDVALTGPLTGFVS